MQKRNFEAHGKENEFENPIYSHYGSKTHGMFLQSSGSVVSHSFNTQLVIFAKLRFLLLCIVIKEDKNRICIQILATASQSDNLFFSLVLYYNPAYWGVLWHQETVIILQNDKKIFFSAVFLSKYCRFKKSSYLCTRNRETSMMKNG